LIVLNVVSLLLLGLCYSSIVYENVNIKHLNPNNEINWRDKVNALIEAAKLNKIDASGYYTNPVEIGTPAPDAPDPFMLVSEGVYFAYSTNAQGCNIPCMVSADLTSFALNQDALPQLPNWAQPLPGSVWAPAVWINAPGRYILYYVCHIAAATYAKIYNISINSLPESVRENGKQCISSAVASTPVGPFVDSSSAPLVCPPDSTNVLDPTIFVDPNDNTPYLIWVNNGPSLIGARELSSDGQSFVGSAVELISPTLGWENGVTEGPGMRFNSGKYYLTYSGNDYDSSSYAVGYAECKTPLGPCDKHGNPILVSKSPCLGPGGSDWFVDNVGQYWFVYHGWTAPYTNYPEGKRSLRIDKIYWSNSDLFVVGPTTTPTLNQTMPYLF